MTTPAHVPVLLDRVVALLAPALDHDGRRPRRRHPRPRRPHRGGARPRCELARVVGIDRDPDALDAGRASGWRRSATGSPACTRSTTRSPTSSTTSASTRVDAVLFDLGVSSMQLDVARARLRLRRGRAARHADGRHRRPDRRRRAQHLLRPPTWPGSCGSTARRSSPARSPRAVVREREQRAVHHLGPPRRAAVRRDPGAGPPYRRTPGQAHLPGAADGGQRRARRAAPGDARPRSTRSASAAAWSWSPTTRWRTGWSSRPSPPPPAATSRDDLPFVPEGHEPALRLVTRGAEKADAAEIDAQPPRRLRPAARRRTRQHRPRGSRSMSSPAVQLRSASARARASPRPPSSGPG